MTELRIKTYTTRIIGILTDKMHPHILFSSNRASMKNHIWMDVCGNLPLSLLIQYNITTVMLFCHLHRHQISTSHVTAQSNYYVYIL